ncbi:MAG: DUF2812 domain-containing protein [Firmicutes bacterium]|jgi:hypothetical protein|nr:DUF2812 domain-containing protein [Bacillota bacterium]
MKKTIYKWFWAWNYDKEEEWLNEMAAMGLSLASVGFCTYIFEETLPGEYKVRIQLLDHFPSHPESMNYIKFLEETGIEHVGSITRWNYFRKKMNLDDSQKEFDLFSDSKSRQKHLGKMMLIFGILALANLLNAFTQVVGYQDSGRGYTFPIIIFLISIGLLLSYGFFKIYIKWNKLKKENRLFE